MLTSTRRPFLSTAASTALAASALPAMLRAGTAPAVTSGTNLNNRIGVGFIGTGSRSGAHMWVLQRLQSEDKLPIEFAAVCDLNWPRVQKAQTKLKASKAYMDRYGVAVWDGKIDAAAIEALYREWLKLAD